MNTSDTRVLIVEDDFLVCEMIRGVLEDAGYVVAGTAADGQQAIEMTQSIRPDVVLMDIGLPDVDGIQATRHIYESCPTPVVILTAYDAPEIVEQVSEAGAGAYLVKPSTAREMERAITITMARFDDMMELRRLNAELQAEIVERIQAEEQIKASLEEKEVLLQEIQHRVRNNLQFIHNLLDLQAGYIQDRQAVEMFRESQKRIHAIALVHDRLCQSIDLARINLGEYIQDLADDLFRSYNVDPAGINLKTNLENITVNTNTAISCGLIINELVSNGLKHAFTDRISQQGEIYIESHSIDDGRKLTVVVKDNGISLPPDKKLRKKKSFGLELVNVLVQQLKGTIEIDRNDGTTFRITLPDHFPH